MAIKKGLPPLKRLFIYNDQYYFIGKASEAIKAWYKLGITDEFIPPTRIRDKKDMIWQIS